MLQFSKLLLSFLCLQAMLYATDEKIPDSALQLIKKLSAWEEDLEKKFLEERYSKRKQVAQALNSELDRATRKGDLSGALALKQYIDDLSSNDSINHSVYLEKVADNNLVAMIVGTKWTWPVGNKSSVHFIDSEKMSQLGVYNQENYQSLFSWKQVGNNTIEFERKGEWTISGRIEFDRDFKSAKINLKRRDGQEIKSRIKRVETD